MLGVPKVVGAAPNAGEEAGVDAPKALNPPEPNAGVELVPTSRTLAYVSS